jgi:hypothetical protein
MVEPETLTSVEPENSNIETLVDHLKQYVETRLELAKLDTAAGVSSAVALITRMAILFFTAAIVLIFASCGVAILLGQLLHNSAYGYLSVAAFYLITGVSFYLLQGNRLKLRVTNAILKRLTNDR